MNGDNPSKRELGSIKTEILVAYIFAILVLVGWIAALIYALVVITILSGLLGPFGGYYIGFGIIYTIIFLVLMIPSILVVSRVGKMYNAAKREDVKKLKELNSIGWAIVALIFTGIIPGIMLLIAHGPINDLSEEEEGGLTSAATLDKLLKLKSLLDSGVISQEEYEKQKNAILHPETAKLPPGPEEDLKRLKALLDSGAISQEEYDQQKEIILKKMIQK